MTLSERQKDILQKAVFEYIDQAQPVSSSWLEKRYDMEVSPATIRNELLSLTEEGYLEQPYTSAGRIPTDQGYRFFVDEVLGSGELEDEFDAFVQARREQDQEDVVRSASRNMAEASSSLAIVYFPEKGFLWKEGWEEVLRAPEFETREQIEDFTNFLHDVEKGIHDFHPGKLLEIYIGKENPFSREEDFSIMISAYSFPKKQKGLLALAGPKRMEYQKNIGLMNSLRRIFA